MTSSDGQFQGGSPEAREGAGPRSTQPDSAAGPSSPGPQGESRQLALDRSTADSVIQVHTDKHRLTAFLTLRPLSDSATLDPEVIVGLVLESGLLFVEDDLAKAKEIILAYCASRTPVEMAVIARGLEPLPGEDGKIEWAIEYEEKKVIDEDSRIDFRQKEMIRNVRKGEKLLAVLPPEKGLPGRDVFGTEIAARPGKTIHISRGANVRAEDDGASFYADADGRVSFERNLLRVDPIIEVREDLDYSVGNIDFSGYVYIYGGVLDGFVVKASRGITIAGTVGAATLESDSDIAINGGIAGRGKGSIKCGGKLVAKYLNQISAQVNGDMTISTEIHNCTVNCLGSITVHRGSIIGGEITALGSVTAPTIGSLMGVRTVISAGVNFTIMSKLREIRAAISSSDNMVKKMAEKLAPFLQNRERLASLPPEKLELVRNLLLQLQNEQQTLKGLCEQEQELVTTEQSQTKKIVMVGRRLHAGVEIVLGDCRTSITDDLDGPLKLTPNEADGTVRIRGVDK